MSGRGGTGRRWGLKILCHWRAGSSPAVRTSLARGLCAALIVTSTTSCGRRPDVGPVVASVIGGEPDLAARRRGDLSTPDRVLTDALAEGLVRFDATGQIEFGQFKNQIEYQDAGSAINNEVKKVVLAGIDPAALNGKTVTVIGAFKLVNPKNWIVTPVRLDVK